MERERVGRIAAAGVLGVVVISLLVGLALVSTDSAQPESPQEAEVQDRRSADGLIAALDTIGGVEELVLGTASGPFDLVRFDPLDSTRLLAVHRRSYGEAENQLSNEIWTLENGVLTQELWAPDTAHDFAHFNADGTITRWVHGGGPDFAPRIAQVLDRDLEQVTESDPLYASRFVVDDGRVFALLGDGFYGSDAPYGALVADDGTYSFVLAQGQNYEWIDTPAPGLLVAYSATGDAKTRVWNTETLEEVVGHALSDRDFQRAAISQDGSTAAGVSPDGALSVIDLRTGQVTHSFGSFEVAEIDRPITLNGDGTAAVIVETDGTVSLWWLEDGTRLLSINGDSAQPRWVSEVYAPKSATAVSWDATRLAVRIAARPDTPTSWTIVDVDVDSWLQRSVAAEGQ